MAHVPLSGRVHGQKEELLATCIQDPLFSLPIWEQEVEVEGNVSISLCKLTPSSLVFAYVVLAHLICRLLRA